MINARTLVLFLGIVAITGCTQSLPTLEQPPGPPALTFGMVPFNDLPVLYRQSRAISTYLSNNLNRPIRFVLVPDYASVTELLTENRLDIAWLTPLPYARFRDSWDYELLCTPVRRGRTSHRGVIVVRTDSPFHSLSDLQGHRFAYVDRYSTTGFVFPNLLFQQQGISPLSFFARIDFATTHAASLHGVLRGDYDGAAVYDQAPLSALSSDEQARIRVIATTPEIPSDPIVVSRTLPAQLRDELRRLLLTMDSHPGGNEVITVLKHEDGIEGFREAREEAYGLLTVSDGEPSEPAR